MAAAVSAISVTAAVIQIVDAVSKLRSLWQSVKNAPEDLTDCVRDIERTTKILDNSKALFLSVNGIDDETLRECTQDLEAALAALQNVVCDLVKTLDKHELLAALKTMLKKDEIARGKRKLKRAQSLLSFAQQNLSLVLQLRCISMTNENHQLLSQISSVLRTSSRKVAVNSHAFVTTTPTNEVTYVQQHYEAKSTAHNVKLASSYLKKANKIYCVRFPRWLTRKCFELAYYHEIPLLQLSFHNEVDWKSPAFEATRKGNLEELQHLLEMRHVHPYDRSSGGDTILTEALRFNRLDIAEFLIAQYPVLSSQITINALRSTIFFLSWPLHTALRDTGNSAQFFRELSQFWNVLTRCIDIEEEMLSNIEQTLNDFLGVSQPWVEWLPKLVKVADFGLDILCREAKAFYAMTTPSFGNFEHIRGQDIPVRDLLEMSLKSRYNHVFLLKQIALVPPGHWIEWADVLREIFNFDRSKACESHWSTTTLSDFLIVSYHRNDDGDLRKMKLCWPKSCNTSLQDWIQFLEGIGIDLEHYGMRESQLSLQRWNKDVSGWRLLGLIYGPKATDWKIFYCPDGWEYDLAGEFWDWVENPELFMVPGAFWSYHEESVFNVFLFSESRVREATREEWQRKGYNNSAISKRERRLRKRAGFQQDKQPLMC